jgi:tetraacyldisaccharide 4'-kinase
MKMRSAADIIVWPAGDRAARVLGASARPRYAGENAFLSILETLYTTGVSARNSLFDSGVLRGHRAGIPVISVGNIVAGGAGKTPFTRWLASRLRDNGLRVAIGHGGYGSDEPALHRQWRPDDIVIEERDRVRATVEAKRLGAQVIVLDDAFQHRRLARDLDIVLMPVEAVSRRLLPRGPLREPERELARADLLVVTRKSGAPESARALAERLRAHYDKPVAIAAILPELTSDAPTEPVVAVSSIARPDILLDNLRSIGMDVASLLAYPDHHDYTATDVAAIVRAAGTMPIVTTEKDAVKLSKLIAPRTLIVIGQRVSIEAGEDVIRASLARFT